MARLGSKVLNDAPVDDDPKLLNFTAAMSWIVGWMSFLSQKY
jgi:Fe-S-cluster formation regulator IscX/YfhJ